MRDTRLTRRALVLTAVAGLLSGRRAHAWSAPAPVKSGQVVEDWRDVPLGSRGVPPGWQKYETPGGQPAYDFTVVEDGGRRALDLKSAADHSTIAKEVHVALAATPLLEWEWKVLALPRGADLQVEHGEELAVRAGRASLPCCALVSSDTCGTRACRSGPS